MAMGDAFLPRSTLWAKLDDIDSHSEYWLGDADEALAFSHEVTHQIGLKLGRESNSSQGLLQYGPADPSPVAVAVGTSAVDLDLPPVEGDGTTTSARQSPSGAGLTSPDTSRPLAMSTRTSTRTPARTSVSGLAYSHQPTQLLQTPSEPKPLPPPPARTRGSRSAISGLTDGTSITSPAITSVDSPAVPTPSTTPARAPGSVGKRKREVSDTDSPIPLAKQTLLNKNSHFKPISDHWAKITMAGMTASPSGGNAGRGRGRGRGRASGVRVPSRLGPGLGGNIFKGFRFCYPATNKLDRRQLVHRWSIIESLGAQVVLVPDSAITHVIYEDSTSESLLARSMGIESLSELPEGTLCVKFKWVARCKEKSQVFPPLREELCFPPTTLGRMTSVGGLSRGSRSSTSSNLSLRRVWQESNTDSDTESSERIDRRRVAMDHEPRAGPAKRQPSAIFGGPGWVAPLPGQEDDLDRIITGIAAGELDDAEMSSDGGNEEDGSTEPNNPNPLADKFKCGQKNVAGKEKNGPNEWLAQQFDQLAMVTENRREKNDWQKGAPKRAAAILRKTPYQITSGTHARKTIKGIGGQIADRIDEFLNNTPGRMQYMDDAMARVTYDFAQIYGVGQNIAHELWQRGARSIDDLRKDPAHYKLTAGQKIGLDLYDDLITSIPRQEAKEIFEKIRDKALSLDPLLLIDVMGSYRRGAETCGDVDVLITRDPSDGGTHKGILEKVVKGLTADGIITHDLSVPGGWNCLEAKWMGVGRLSAKHLYRRIDILCIPFESFGASLLYFTGNDIFNRSLRLYARRKGYSLNQRGLYKDVYRDRRGVKQCEVAGAREEDIFKELGVRWRPPHHRCA